MNRRLYHTVYQSLKNGHFPVVLGGDHSIAAGSISAVSKFYGSIGIIWVDAHGDWNNEESSQTGNMHGMPFSAVCGYGPDCMVDFGQGPVYVDVAHCVQIAGQGISTPGAHPHEGGRGDHLPHRYDRLTGHGGGQAPGYGGGRQRATKVFT